MNSVPHWLILWVWRALLGEIYPAIRAIAVMFSNDRILTIRYYLDRVPNEEDYEGLSVVATNVWANTSSVDQIRDIKEECVYDERRLGELDSLDGFVFARKEF